LRLAILHISIFKPGNFCFGNLLDTQTKRPFYGSI
jgi:hypothetical protein